MTPKQKDYENKAKTIIRNMGKRRIEGHYFPDSASAVASIMEMIPSGSSIGWGGTMTAQETGLMDALQAGDYDLIDRTQASGPSELRQFYNRMFAADYFLMSSNAVTMDGELINIDGNGNRVACLCYGPEFVIVLVGMNKVVTDVDAGLKRARLFAAPTNGVRLGLKTPCAVTGKCEDCYSDECMCGQFVVTRHSYKEGRIKVFLIGEELGY
jgi:hypothetical protein